MLSLDLHTHTRFFHWGTQSTWFDPLGSWLLCLIARHRGLDGVALTNHNYYRSFGRSFVCIPGVEITTTCGHVLVVGPDPPTSTEPDTLTPEETVSLAHDRGCAAIIAHPYRNSTVREVAESFDAIEVMVNIHARVKRSSDWQSNMTCRWSAAAMPTIHSKSDEHTQPSMPRNSRQNTSWQQSVINALNPASSTQLEIDCSVGSITRFTNKNESSISQE